MRSAGEGAYRFGFNGKENDNEVKGGEGLQQDYGMRIYDPRLGRFLSVDPLTVEYPDLTPYQFAGNMPVIAMDRDGLEPLLPWDPTSWFFWKTKMSWKYGDPTGARTAMRGAVQQANVETGRNNYHREEVPGVVQQRLDDINHKEGQAKVIQGSGEIIAFNVETSADVTLNLIPGEAFAVAGRSLKFAAAEVLKTSPSAEKLVVEYAERIIASTSNNKMPRTATVIVDEKTGRVYEGISGELRSMDDVGESLKRLLPKDPPIKAYPVQNCSECAALDKALKVKADIKNLKMHTVVIEKKTKTVKDVERCANCKITTKEMKTPKSEKSGGKQHGKKG